MGLKGYEKFLELRKWFMEKLRQVDFSYGCKHYEGTFEILFSYPSYFDVPSYFDTSDYLNDGSDGVVIYLHCYVIGPHRHYKWYGKTIEEAVNKARTEIESWDD